MSGPLCKPDDALRRSLPASRRHLLDRIVLPTPGLGTPRWSVISTQAHDHACPPLTVAGEVVEIPSRMYYRDPQQELVTSLDPAERVALACLYTRSHDASVRQRELAHLLTADEPWVVPFVVQLCGEYVVEICQDVQAFVRDDLPRRPRARRAYSNFIEQNRAFVRLTQQRARSYWRCYHWRTYSFVEYPGLDALTRLSAIV